MPGDVASATSPGIANRTLHPASDAWRLLKVRWELAYHPQPAYPNDQLPLRIERGIHREAFVPTAVTHLRPFHSEVSPRSACSTLTTDLRAVATATASPHPARPCPC